MFFQGKVRMVKFVSMNEDLISSINILGAKDEPSVAVKEKPEILVCPLYQVKLETDINGPRYKLFTKEKKPPPPRSLPPTKDTFYLHIELANYQ